MDMKLFSWPTTRTILLTLAIGGAAGIIGTAITSSTLSDYSAQLNEQTRPLQNTQQSPRAFPASYADAVSRFTEVSLPSVATVYPKSPKGLFGYSAEESISSGVVLTSDGWIALSSNVSKTVLDQSVIQVKNALYPITNVEIDPVTLITFIKVQAMDLPVVGFGAGLDLTLGQEIFVASGAKAFALASVLKQEWPQGVIVSTDVPARRVLIQTDHSALGASVFDLSGSFDGFVNQEDAQGSHVIPAETILPALHTLLEKKSIHRIAFGAEYIDLAHTVGFSETTSRAHTTGAYITGRPAVKKGSPAALAGITEGDIILSVNGQNIDELHGLDERFLSFNVGDIVSLVLDRAGKKLTVSVVLGEYGK